MNIFVLHENPRVAARMHCDKHVVKMIVETAQMLSTAHHIHDSKFKDFLYKPAYTHHPCTKWVSSSSSNYRWTLKLFESLLEEYSIRYNKTHKSMRLLLSGLINNPCPKGKLTEFALAMPDIYKTKNAIHSYRKYYIKDKSKFATWKVRNTPSWFLKNG